jgi:hypothetical protein
MPLLPSVLSPQPSVHLHPVLAFIIQNSAFSIVAHDQGEVTFLLNMAKRDLKLNSLGRYAKQSSRLVLEQHDNCEVPAGCGGVVLRWRSEISELPVLLHSYTSGKSKLFIDGQLPDSSRSMISFGDHVLSLVLEEVPKDAILAVAVAHNSSRVPLMSQQLGEVVNVLSDADGTWKSTTVNPDDDNWMNSGFDDSSWAALKAAQPPVLQKRAVYTGENMWEIRLQMALDAGAKCLGLTTPTGQIWVRRAFRLSRPEGRP